MTKWEIEYTALKVFYLKPMEIAIKEKRKVLIFISSMLFGALGLWLCNIYWVYAFWFGFIIYPLSLFITFFIVEEISFSIAYKCNESYRLRLSQIAHCPVCNHTLRTGLAKQCKNCHFDWH